MNIKKKILLVIIFAALLIMFLFAIYGNNGLKDLKQLEKKKDVLIKRNNRLAGQNNSFCREIERLKNDPEYIESLARQKLKLVSADEIILKTEKKNK